MNDDVVQSLILQRDSYIDAITHISQRLRDREMSYHVQAASYQNISPEYADVQRIIADTYADAQRIVRESYP